MTAWTIERAAVAIKLWADGLSASQIANVLGGVTRNAICGFVHRNKLPKRAVRPPVHVSREERARRQIERHDARIMMRPAPSFKAPRRLRPSPGKFLGVTLLDLTPKQCRYPSGEDMPYLFCGQPQQYESSYCPSCHAIAYGRPAATPEQIERARKARFAKNRVYGRAA